MYADESDRCIPTYAQPQKQIADNPFKKEQITLIYKNIDVSEQMSAEREYDVVYEAGLVQSSLTEHEADNIAFCEVAPEPMGSVMNDEKTQKSLEELSTIPANNSLQPVCSPSTGSTNSDERNQFGYRSYKFERPEENCQPPCIKISHLSYSVDARKNWERFMLRMSKRHFLIRDVSFELCAGDILAVMSPSESESRSLLDVLAGQIEKGQVKGEILINEHHLKPEQLAARTAYVTTEDLPNWLTVVQYLRINAALNPPATKAIKIENMIDQLLATLALTLRRHTLCSRLNNTELQRLKIAAQLLKDADILICDNVTKDMDSYEVAFAVDYLREWAMKLNRIVVIAIAPPSFDILLMFSKCLLLTSRRIAYFNSPTKMVNYFESIGYSCPAYKNPCDFYVDVLTHDHLTQTASEESSTRIEKLVQAWQQDSVPSPCICNAPLSANLCRASVLGAMLALYRQSWYEFTNHPSLTMSEALAALLTSLVISVSFSFSTREKRVGADDRIGFAVAALFIGLIPWIYVVIHKVSCEKTFIQSTLRRTQLSSTLFLLFKLSCEFPIMILTSALYCIPFFLIVDMNFTANNRWLWVGSFYCVMFAHFLVWRLIAQSLAFLTNMTTTAFHLTMIALIVSYSTSGLVVPSAHLNSVVLSISPHKWFSQALLEAEFAGLSFLESSMCEDLNNSELVIGCDRKEVLARKIKGVPIFTLSQCKRIRGSQLLYFYGFLENITTSCGLSLHFIFGCSVIASWILALFFVLTCSLSCAV